MLMPGTKPGNTGGPDLGEREGVKSGYTEFEVPKWWYLSDDLQKEIENIRSQIANRFENCGEKSFETS